MHRDAQREHGRARPLRQPEPCCGGLSATEILNRTRGSSAWAAFYAVFVLSVSIHVPIGLRTVAGEWLAWRGRAADLTCLAVGIALLVLGALAIAAVTR